MHFCLKFVHRLLPTGKVLHRRNPIESPYCPACGEIKSNEHFLLCSHCSRLPHLLQLVVQVRRAVDPIKSDPTLKDIFIEGIDSVILEREISIPPISSSLPVPLLLPSQHRLAELTTRLRLVPLDSSAGYLLLFSWNV